MAKKTKKAKQLADRRRLALASQSLAYSWQKSLTSITNIDNKKASSPVYQNGSIYTYPLSLIQKDLTKTLLLSILTVSLELALFLVLEQHLILPFKMGGR
jgi:hypothetical protein